MYAAGPRACGIDADRWTTGRMADAIAERFGVRYDPDHVGRLMHRLGLRPRRPVPVRKERFVAASPAAAYPSAPRYSPNTDFNVSEISPTVQ
jgi:hypothetical protein